MRRGLTYAGIGSRRTPEEVLRLMERIGARLGRRGWTLRTGAAEGADEAFERGARRVGGRVEIYLPWPGFRGRKDGTLLRPSREALELASRFHPAWGSLSRGVQSLHGRNMHVLLGPHLGDPVRLVICWTPDGKVVGGTGHALRAARALGIRIINLASSRLDPLAEVDREAEELEQQTVR